MNIDLKQFAHDLAQEHWGTKKYRISPKAGNVVGNMYKPEYNLPVIHEHLYVGFITIASDANIALRLGSDEYQYIKTYEFVDYTSTAENHKWTPLTSYLVAFEELINMGYNVDDTKLQIYFTGYVISPIS